MRRLTLLIPLVLLTTAVLPSGPLLPTAEAGSVAIQPGDQVSTSTGFCTLNFVFDGVGHLAGRVYIGTAAHCVSGVGQSASTTTYSNFGTVAYVGNANDVPRDYAFIQVRADLVHLVSAAVRGHAGTPVGSTVSSETAIGDQVRFSGYGLGFDVSSITRERRVGIMYGDTSTQYTLLGPIIFGDSGGPILHESGKALGLVSVIAAGCCAGPGVYDAGPTIQGVLADAAAHGFPVALRTV